MAQGRRTDVPSFLQLVGIAAHISAPGVRLQKLLLFTRCLSYVIFNHTIMLGRYYHPHLADEEELRLRKVKVETKS